MKYKGIEINDEWDVFIGVDFEGKVDDVIKSILKHTKGTGIGVEVVSFDYLVVVSNHFNFNKLGINSIKLIYETLSEINIGIVELSVNVQAHDWVFKNGDDEYNTDSVTLDEFLESLEE